MHHGFESVNIGQAKTSHHRYEIIEDSGIGIVPVSSIPVISDSAEMANHGHQMSAEQALAEIFQQKTTKDSNLLCN